MLLGDGLRGFLRQSYKATVSLLLQGESHLVAVVEELGPLLTDIAVGKRKTGLSFLSRLLTELKPHCLNQVQDLFNSVLTEGQSFLSEAPFGENWQGEMGPNETLARKFLTLVLPTTPSKEFA